MCPSMTFDINSFSQCETARMDVVITKETFSNNGKLTPFWMTNQLSVDFNNRLLFLNLLYIFFFIDKLERDSTFKKWTGCCGQMIRLV